MSFPKIKFFTLASLTAFLGAFQIGYHGCVINISEPFFLQFINETYVHRYGHPISATLLDTLWAWIVSIICLGSLIGCLITPLLMEKFGRKISFMIFANLLAIGASLLMAFSFMARSYEMLGVGRFLMGISNGISFVGLPIYLNECSPTEHRGVMGVIQNFSFNFLNVLAYVLALPQVLGTTPGLPMLVGLGCAPALLQMVISFFLTESPKFLYINRKDKMGAEKSLQFWNDGPKKTPEEIEATIREFDMEAAALAKELGLLQAMKIPYFRRVLAIALVIMFCQVATGYNAVICYSADMFSKLGFDTLTTNVCTAMIGVVGTVAAMVSGPFVEKYSRRSMYFSSFFIVVLFLILYSIFYILYDHTSLSWSAYSALVCMFVYVFIFNTVPCGLSSVIPLELSPQAIRSAVNSLASAFFWILAVVCTFAYPPVWHSLGSCSYFFFVLPLVAGLIYLYKVMPETAGKSIGEIVIENLCDSASVGTVSSDDKIMHVKEKTLP